MVIHAPDYVQGKGDGQQPRPPKGEKSLPVSKRKPNEKKAQEFQISWFERGADDIAMTLGGKRLRVNEHAEAAIKMAQIIGDVVAEATAEKPGAKI